MNEPDTVLSMDTPLFVRDRCDRCGGQAYVRATLEGGTELLFCGHHGRANMDALMQVPGIYIHDETDRLNPVS